MSDEQIQKVLFTYLDARVDEITIKYGIIKLMQHHGAVPAELDVKPYIMSELAALGCPENRQSHIADNIIGEIDESITAVMNMTDDEVIAIATEPAPAGPMLDIVIDMNLN